MFKPNKLLKVVSIILIIIGVLTVIMSIVAYVGTQSLSSIDGIDMSLIENAYSPLTLIVGIVSSLMYIGCGILGVIGKAHKVAFALMVLYIITSVISTFSAGIVFNAISTITFVIGLVLPVLYLWGLYQSK